MAQPTDRIYPYVDADGTYPEASMNAIIEVCRAVQRMRGTRGVNVHVSSAGIVVDIDPAKLAAIASEVVCVKIVGWTVDKTKFRCRWWDFANNVATGDEFEVYAKSISRDGVQFTAAALDMVIPPLTVDMFIPIKQEFIPIGPPFTTIDWVCQVWQTEGACQTSGS